MISNDGLEASWLDCEHAEEELRVREFSNGSRHFVRQCLHCGRASNAISREALSDEDRAAAPEFDEGIQERYWERRSEAMRRARTQRDQEHAERVDELRAKAAEYRKTLAWQHRRGLVLNRAGWVCEGCRIRPATQVHHLTNEHYGNEFLWELVAVCRECHTRYHGVEGELW